MGAPHAGQLVAFELIAWPQSLHVVSLRFADVGTCRTPWQKKTRAAAVVVPAAAACCCWESRSVPCS